MKQKPAKPPTQAIPLMPDYQEWRAEIESFCRKTIVHLQSLIQAVEREEASDLAPASDVTETSRPSGRKTEPPIPRLPNPPPPPATPPPAAPAVTEPTPGDLATSQDRLANLKRELAAKLSNARREEK